MGLNLNIETDDENEFNRQLHLHFVQGYDLQSNHDNVAILKRKSFNIVLMIILLFLFFPLAIAYYLISSEDFATIKLKKVSSDAFCSQCGEEIYEGSKFCTACGCEVNMDDSALCKN